MPVQAFVDDSGGKGHGTHFVLAGLIADAENWAQFSDAWHLCLGQDPAIAYFKMREATGLSGQFHRFSKPRRDEKLRSLAALVDQYADTATLSIIDLDAHSKTWGRTEHKPLNEVYFWPFQNTILASCFELWDQKRRERFEIIFDEQVVFGPRAKAWYPAIRDTLRHREPGPHSIMPVDPLFRTDDEFMPLQAADFLAGCCRRRLGGDQQFDWLLEGLPTIHTSDHSQHYDLKRMQSVTDEAERLVREGAIVLDVVEKYRDLFERK